MHFRQKLAYMALGGVLVLAGHILPGMVVGSATAQGGLQDAYFGTVTAHTLLLLSEGAERPGLYASAMADGGYLSIKDANGTTAASLSATSDGGVLAIRSNPDGKIALLLSPDSDGGKITLSRTDGELVRTMGVSPDGEYMEW